METDKMEVREAGDGAAAGEFVRVPSKRYTWSEVRQAVHDLRKELSSLSTMVPMAISFRKLGNGKTRIYFLRTPQNGWEITLLYTDVTPSPHANNTRLEWKPLIESNVALGVNSGKWSREEQLLWERQRVAACGIASYELHPSGRVLFPCSSSLFVCEEGEGNQTPPLVPRALHLGSGAPLTPAMCPRSPALVAHAARGDIWLAGAGLRPQRLTYASTDSSRLSDDPRQAGVPCYVTQEEFSRYTGFWWQPCSDDDVFRIVYEEVDESNVKIFSFPSSQSSSGEVEEFRFPRAGTPNAKSILRLVTFKLQKASPTVLDYYYEGNSDSQSSENTNDAVEVTDIRWFDLRQSLKETFPWFEYLARVGWTPCGNYVWVQLLDRKQQRLELALIPAREFCAPAHYPAAPARATLTAQEHPEQPIQILVQETAPDVWINVHDILHFLPSLEPGTVRFIWGSEQTGHLHLYLITCRIARGPPERVRTVMEMITEEENLAIGPNIISKEPITAGEWEVLGRKIWVDEARNLVYFVGLRETPLERHLYAAPLAPPRPHQVTLLTTVGHSCAVDMDDTLLELHLYAAPLTPPRPHQVTLLTTVGHSCAVDMDDECTLAVITSSNISTAPSTRAYRVAHAPAPTLIAQGLLMDRAPSETSSDTRSYNGSWDSRSGDGDNDDNDSSEASILVKEHALSTGLCVPPPQIFTTRLSCGLAAYCTLWRGARSGRGPTVLHVYGGPEVQTVTNSYKGIRQLRMHMLAARGFNVVAIDSRGSKHRGRAWEGAIRGKMGQVELDDQVEVLQWLAKETDCIDMERVAIHGWSYGGYLSLLGLATRPNIFRVCVAGAPVTCWRLYDTAYTERYMGLPARAPHAYTRASVLAHAPFFPDQEGRLLIIHGLADENVHFCHTAALLSELVRLGKPHRVQVYPGERHSLRAMHAAKHYEATLLHFLHENL